MDNTFTAKVSLLIDAPQQKVWEALTNPAVIKQYLYGTEVASEWTVGSSITFSGNWEGKAYLDKGIILQIASPGLFQYSYLSSWNNLPDIPENYATITYQLTEEKDITLLQITQDGISDQAQKEHSEQNWKNVMTAMKKLIE